MGCVCCRCGDSDRGCCEPIIPLNDKAKCWNIVLIVILVLHIILIGVKAWYLGIFSIIIDLAAVAILWVALARYDYCQIMVYIVLNLVEVFSIIVILGYYLQTDMGQNVPMSDGDNGPKDPAGDDKAPGGGNHHDVIPDETDPRDYQKLVNQTTTVVTQQHSVVGSMLNAHHKKKNHGMIVVFRNLFDDFLKLRYHFYAEITNGDFAKPADNANVGLSPDGGDDDMNVMVQSGGDDAKTHRLAKHGSLFLIVFCAVLIVFYITVCILAHCAYREFKGIAEDCAGGSVNLVDGNILYFAIIDKREDDAIEEKEENFKRRQERARQRAMMSMMNNDEEVNMMNGEGGEIE